MQIDASSRVPVLVFFSAAVAWLVVGTILALLASVKMHHPGFLADVSWLTFGRVRPAHLNTMSYGWASQAGIGVMLWMFARLSKARLRLPRLLIVAAVIWNVALLAGTLGILAGQSTAVEWLEFPPYVAPILTFAFAIMAVAAFLTFSDRQEGHVYVSQWYLFGATFWFPWLYLTGNLLILFVAVSGVLQPAVNWWFAHNVLGLWLTPIGLAAAYYLIPKVLGRPIHSYYLSIIGFWALAFFYNSAGIHHLIGGPVPAWLITYSIVASVMMLIPVGTVAINHHMTMLGRFRALRYSPTLQVYCVRGDELHCGECSRLAAIAPHDQRSDAFHALHSRPRSFGRVRVLHDDHVRQYVLHRATIDGSGMVISESDSGSFLDLLRGDRVVLDLPHLGRLVPGSEA